MKKLITFFVVFVLFATTRAWSGESIDPFLQRFQDSPYSAMQEVPEKIDLQNATTPLRKTLNEPFFEQHSKEREKFCIYNKKPDGTVFRQCIKGRGKAGIAGNDHPENLVDNPNTMINNIYDLDGKYQNAQLPKHPWSSDYWPLRVGATAKRYNDVNFPGRAGVDSWHTAYSYYVNNGATANRYSDLLSPAEKYDLLVGDDHWTLTKEQWSEGERFQKEYNNVEPWMGICHGWAPASYMEKRPAKSITVRSAKNIAVTFYPDDIKALTVLKWANGVPVSDNQTNNSKFIGGRCDEKNPKIDPETGRVVDQNCFDTNPGSWHVAVSNQLGVNQRSFVMDASYDYEVWNQPVFSYQYTYFNPKTMHNVDSLKEAIVETNDNEFHDKFKKFRDSKAYAVVGIIMNVAYMAEAQPQGKATDGPQYDVMRRVRYYYDLEISQNGTIIGGEWYMNTHPDFLWTPAKDAVALNPEDHFVQDTWDTEKPVSPNIAQYAPSASRAGAPLRAIINGLLEASASDE